MKWEQRPVPTGTRRFYIFTVTDRKSLPTQILRRRSFQATVPEIRVQEGSDAASGPPDGYPTLGDDIAWRPPASPQEDGWCVGGKHAAHIGAGVEASLPREEVLP